MAENLKTTRYNDSSSINVHWYNNDEATYKNVYGGLYYRTSSNKICPTGWHLPSGDEWEILLEYLGVFTYNLSMSGIGDAGGKLKEVGSEHWNSPNVGATDEVGFTALPGGIYYDGIPFGGEPLFQKMGESGYWWGYDSPYNYAIYINSNGSNCTIERVSPISWEGNKLSIRCIKD